MKRVLCLLIVACLLIGCIPCIASASEITVTDAAGFTNAINSIEDGGTIRINGSISITSWPSVNKTVTVTGGTLQFSNLTLGCNAIFQSVTLSGTTLYANGYRLYIGENVSTSSSLTVYGGRDGGSVPSTDVTILSGNYVEIYGGSHGGTVTGNVNLTVGGNTNAAADPTSHSKTYCVYGGSKNGAINGTVNLTFTGSAKANYVYGGSYNGSGRIAGDIHFVFSGGNVMSVYGGSRNVNHDSNVDLTISGGTIAQVFGGNESSSLTGNVNVNLLGGKITRRIYGGCYNEVTQEGLFNFVWHSSYYVTGNVTLSICGGMSIPFSSTDNDRSIYAHSRQKTLSSSENTQIIFLDSTAYSTYKDKLKARDIAMQLIMGNTSAADAIHYFTYTASGASITQSCSYHKDVTATATLSASDSTYTGSEIKTAAATLSSTWISDAPVITYSNNINAGTATATMTVSTATASVNFTIHKASQNAPAVSAVGETIKGKADGKINGLTTAMVISTNGTSYSAVTDANASFAPGKYYVRYPATANADASSPAEITIAEGRMLTVTFKAEGSADIVKEVAWNETLTDIPAVPAKAGTDASKSVWCVTNFQNIQQDMVVNAIYSAKTFTVKFVADGKTVAEQTIEYGKDAVLPQIPDKTGYTGAWDKSGKNITADTIITAKYSIRKYSVEYFVDGIRVHSEAVEHGKNASQPAIKEKTGHTAAWDHDGKNITKDTVITAEYTPKTYKVTYIADGKTVATKDVPFNQNATAPAIPEKSGYTAVWDKDGKNITADTTITAIYASVNAGKYIDATPKDNYAAGALTQSAEQLRLTVPMSKSEQEKIDNGEDVTIRFIVTDVASTISSDNKNAIQAAVKDANTGAYLELGMYKQVGTANETSVTILNSDVTVTITLPPSLMNTDSNVERAYDLVRVENGKATVIDHIFDNGIISFNTSGFGTFAIVYTDTQIVEVAPPVIEVPTTPVEDPTDSTSGTEVTTPGGSTESTNAPSTDAATQESVPEGTAPGQNDAPASPLPVILIVVSVILVLAGGGCGLWLWYQKKKKAQL